MTKIVSSLLATAAVIGTASFIGLASVAASAMPVDKLAAATAATDQVQQVRLRHRRAWGIYAYAHRPYYGRTRFVRESPNWEHPYADYGKPDSW